LPGLFQIFSQAIERSFPKFSIVFDPLGGLLERLRVQFHFMNTSVTASAEESGLFQNAQMFRDRRQRHVVWAGEVSDATIAAGEMSEDVTTGRIGQSSESPIQRGRRIFNHLVKYINQAANRASRIGDFFWGADSAAQS